MGEDLIFVAVRHPRCPMTIQNLVNIRAVVGPKFSAGNDVGRRMILDVVRVVRRDDFHADHIFRHQGFFPGDPLQLVIDVESYG